MSKQHLLNADECALMVIDVQGALAKMVVDSDAVIQRIEKLVRAARLLTIPIIWVEQNPQGLGRTVQVLADALEDTPCYQKTRFNAMDAPVIASAVTQLNRRHMLVCGIESHVCVYQTVSGVLNAGMHVSVIEDGVSSRTEANRTSGIRRMSSIGATVRSMEMALFELMRDASHPQFKQILSLIK